MFFEKFFLTKQELCRRRAVWQRPEIVQKIACYVRRSIRMQTNKQTK